MLSDFENELHRLSLRTQLPIKELPMILDDLAGVLMQEARVTLFEDREEVVCDPDRIRQELVRMGHDAGELKLDRVRLLLDFFLHHVMDPQDSRN